MRHITVEPKPRAIINAVIDRLIEQGPSGYVDEWEDEAGYKHQDPQCNYRLDIDGETRGCAAGLLISDEYYSPNLEGKTIVRDVQEAIKATQGWSDEEAEPLWYAIRALQNAHDNSVTLAGEFPQLMEQARKDLLTTYDF